MADDVAELSAEPVHCAEMDVLNSWASWLLLGDHFLFVLLFPPLFDERPPHVLQQLGLEVEVDEIAALVLLLADDAGLAVQLHLLQGLAGNGVAAVPKGNELVEPVVLQLGDRAGHIIIAALGGLLDDDLDTLILTFLMSVNFLMQAYFSGSSLRTKADSRFSQLQIQPSLQMASGSVSGSLVRLQNLARPIAMDSAVGISTFFRSLTSSLRPGISPPSLPISYMLLIKYANLRKRRTEKRRTDHASILMSECRLRMWRFKAILEEYAQLQSDLGHLYFFQSQVLRFAYFLFGNSRASASFALRDSFSSAMAALCLKAESMSVLRSRFYWRSCWF